jgi:E3 ubiquitin-protein ligase HUWE1
MRFIEAMLSNNATDDHCRAFLQQGGLEPLLKVLFLPNLPPEFPVSSACQAIASIIRFLFVRFKIWHQLAIYLEINVNLFLYFKTLTKDPKVLEQALEQFKKVILPAVEPMLSPLPSPGGSILVEELVKTSPTADLPHPVFPLLRSLGDMQAFLTVLTHISRTGGSQVHSLVNNFL